MSLHPPYYGGFPGPPDEVNSQAPNQQVSAQNSGPHGSNGFQTLDAPGFVRQNMNYYPGPNGSGYMQPIPAGFNYSPHIPNQFVNPNMYYGSPDVLPNQAEFYMPAYPYSANIPFHNNGGHGSSSYDTRYASNEMALGGSGKSRRFSKQRSSKEPGGSGSSGEVGQRPMDRKDSASRSPADMSQGRSLIRFSHQRETPGSASKSDGKKILKSDQRKSSDTAKAEGRSKGRENAQNSGSTKGNMAKRGNLKKSFGSAEIGDGSQTSVLQDQLSSGSYECMVCCDRVKQSHAVWNCSKCYNLFHMGCIKKWARSPAAKVNENETGWRCPGCQNVTKQVPNTYYCFCGKERNPEWKKGEMPHSCGENCSKARKDHPGCTHPCNILCHPGPCPHCPAMINKQCKCRKVTSRVRCSQQESVMCNQQCGKSMNCRLHECTEICHAGPCKDCDVTVKQRCYCEKESREVVCGSKEHKAAEHSKEKGCFSCNEICDRMLDCGNHHCKKLCHPGACGQCPLSPSLITQCPCTQTKLCDMRNEDGTVVTRESCNDVIPTCDKICGKPLSCGGEDIHVCKLSCHIGECPPCEDGESTICCKCGKSEKDASCEEFVSLGVYICDRRCNKKRKCGRHKCGQTCCTESEHTCNQICGRKLTCGIHRCDELCHRGQCHACYNVSFDELRCYCGDKVIYPPIACGTKPPECSYECTRMHPCTHPVRHSCHTDEHCPPCVELVKKPCNCGKVIRGNIMCHIDNVSCGTPCTKVLPCGHKCSKPCHKGPCADESDVCKQPCSIMRIECIHPCANPCHHGQPCPATSCKAMVTLKCPCGHREEQAECSAGGEGYQTLRSTALVGSSGSAPIDIGKLLRPASKRTLVCNEECSIAERNRRLAAALDIKDPDYSSFVKQEYSDFLKSMAKHDVAFVRTVEKDLMNLVESVDWMSSTKQNHAFSSMKSEKRQVVHELAKAFRCESVSQDEEPRRNVVVTATRGVSKRPSPLLSDLMLEQAATEKATLASKTSSSSKGRLLRSMKLVSYKSDVVSSDDGAAKRRYRAARKPITAPFNVTIASNTKQQRKDPDVDRLRSRFDVLSPSSSSLSPRARTPKEGERLSVFATPFPKPTPQASSSNAAVTPSGVSSSTRAGPREPNIDYFDMTD